MKFQFGPSNIHMARKEVSIPIKLGQEVTRIGVKIVHANIPLLIGKDMLKDCRALLDFNNSVLQVHERYQVQLKVDDSGHYLIEHTENIQLVKENVRDS